MKRREFITLVGGAAVAWPLGVGAQQPATPVIGYLGLTTAQSSAYMLASFRKGLSELGFEDGRNVTLDRPVVGDNSNGPNQVVLWSQWAISGQRQYLRQHDMLRSSLGLSWELPE